MIPYVLLQIVVMPAIAATFIAVTRYKTGRKAGWIAGATLLYTTALLCMVGIRVYRGEIIHEVYSLGPLVSFNLLADGLSLPVALIMNLCCVVLAFYSIQYVEHRIEVIYGEVHERTWLMYYTRFFFLFPFFATGFMGIAFATNLIAIYFFMELLTIIPLYFIMAQFGYSDFIERYKVALMCLFWGIAGATLFLFGILLTYTQIGSFEIAELRALSGNPAVTWVLSLMLLGLFVKLAVFPFHAWMPWVHAEHPTCIAGLLAVYANIAAYVIVRVLIIPLYNDITVFATPMMAIALFTIVYGALLTLAQNDVKRLCACSTIGQISYSVLGLGTLNLIGIEGGIFYFLSHILGKTILFSTAGIVVSVTGIRNMNNMGGLVRKMPIGATLWIAASAILTGVPLTSGFTAKWIMFTGVFGAHPTFIGFSFAILGILSTLLTAAYTFWAAKKIFFGPLKPELANNPNIKDPPLTMSLPLLILVAISFIIGLYPTPILDLLHQVIGL